MITNWRRSITSRTLLQLAAAVSIIIVFATLVTYYLIFRAAEDRGRVHLNELIGERAGRLELQCDEIARNLETVREAYLRRYQLADPPDFLAQWDKYFEQDQDGAWRSRREYLTDEDSSIVWAQKDVAPSRDFKRRILIMFEVCQKFLPAWVNSFRSLYGFTSDEMGVVGFDPALAHRIVSEGVDADIIRKEFGFRAMRMVNPALKLVWTGTSADPSSGHSVVSVLLPVEVDGRRIITIAHDMWVDRLIEDPGRDSTQGLTHMIFREDGRVIASPSLSEEIFKRDGKLDMRLAGEPTLKSIYDAVVGQNQVRIRGYDPKTENYYAVHRIEGPGWLYLSMMPRSLLRQPAFHSARWVLWGALASMGLELTVLGFIIRRSIEQPVADLVEATRQLASGEGDVSLHSNRPDELGVLARAFTEMAQKIRERDEALRREKVLLEDRVTERTAELRSSNESLQQSEDRLEEALARQTELVRLKTNFVSLVSHEFRTPLEIITSSAFNLERYHDRLPQEKRRQLLETVKKAVQRMAGMMEQVLFLGRLEPGSVQFDPQLFDLAAFCRQTCEEIEAATAQRCPVDVEVLNDLSGAVGDDAVLAHIFTNLLSNAVKYSPDDSPVRFRVGRVGDQARFEVEDCGCGIPEADQSQIFEAFHRASNVEHTQGTGLGLVIVRRCLELHGGQIEFKSEENRGTLFTVSIPLFTHSTPKT